MNVLVLLVGTVVVFALAARFYGRLVSGWLGLEPGRSTPAVEFQDGRDYVPTNPNVLFAHHFSAIAGAGPILGPTLAILYGYLPSGFGSWSAACSSAPCTTSRRCS